MVDVEQAAPRPLRVVLSYSHKDFDAMAQLVDHLATMRRRKQIELFVDENTPPGDNWEGDIETALDGADVVIFMLSRKLLSSEYCMSREFPRAHSRYEQGATRIIPFLLSSCDHEGSEFGDLKFKVMVMVKGYLEPAEKLGEDAYSAVARELRSLAEARGLRGEPVGGGGARAAAVQLWHGVPRQSAGFYGREDLMTHIARELRQEPHLPVLLSAGGGYGKTRVAAEFAQRHAASYDVVAKIPAEVVATMKFEWAELANRLSLSAGDQQTAIESMRRWLTDTARCLIIFDNATSDDVLELLPENCAADVIITAREPVIAWPRARNIVVGALEPGEALSMLVDAADPAVDTTTLRQIAEFQGFQPLQLAQAARRLRKGKSPERYLERLRAKRNSS